MGLRHLMFKTLRLRRGDGGSNSSTGGQGSDKAKKPSWMTPVSHGYHIVEGRKFRIDQSVRGGSDAVVVQREQIGDLEVWFYGVSDVRIGTKISRYMQTHLFDRKPKESGIRRKSKEAMTKAYLNARAEFKESVTQDERMNVPGSASLVVINGERIVIASMGDYKAIVCRNGMAHHLGAKHQHTGRRHWPLRFLKRAIRIPKVQIQASSSAKEAGNRSSKRPDLIVAADQRVDSETEFVILSSNGVWEVMKNQEAVNLIRHIDDPQEAAQCLAKEALNRMSKSNIACVVVRFD